MMTLARRYAVLLTIAFWMGGFTFYTGVVIPTGNQVMGGERDVGFITQQVTNWLNAIGVIALIILGLNAWFQRPGFPRLLMLLSWLAMIVLQGGLFYVHSVLDAKLDTSTHRISGPMHIFFNWHRLYMLLASAQWGFALIYLWLAVVVWKQTDQNRLIKSAR
ncbi:MAG TPA: hypothetical protein VFB72_20885 [Verrucomicrobiae bacterium]|nr:hypothetical protein [Verrucomicrobiae bacterium]